MMDGILKHDLKIRRQRLMEMAGEDAIVILPAAPVSRRNRDVDYPYRPDSDFYYLTGFPEPEAVAVLIPGREQGAYVLFCRERDPEQEIWQGRRAGLRGAVETYGADDAFPIADLDDILPGMMENRRRVFYSLGRQAEFDQRLLGWVEALREHHRQGHRSPHEFVVLDRLIHEMRLIKSASEIERMQRAADITCRAHQKMMALCRPGLYEYQLEATFLHEAKNSGADLAYPSIVGGGRNACILHYVDNHERLRDGELVLIDAGSEYDCYASDVTRTFPVNGRFNKAQLEVYQLVLAAQIAAIDAVRPGISWDEPHQIAVAILTQGLVDLGLLQGDVSNLIETAAYRRFYMHRTGHWLGLDVHDVGDYKVENGAWCQLREGMVLTIEPGLYIQAAPDIDESFHNIGVRIEDDIQVTNSGALNLTSAAPKTVESIEDLVGSMDPS